MYRENQIAYAEVFEILKYMPKADVMKIPIEILEMLKRERAENYISKIDKENIFKKENMSDKAFNMLSWLDFEYWANEEEKKVLKEQYIKNEYELEKRKLEEYDRNHQEIFSSENKFNENSNFNSELPDIIKKKNLFEKIKESISKFLSKF